MWLIILAVLAPFTPYLDLYLSGLFYTPGVGFFNNAFFAGMFHYGEIFGIFTGVIALFLFFLSFFREKWKKWRKGALLMVLTLAVGAGLITNVLFKGYWGRPRPKQVEQFGGPNLYRPFWKPDFHVAKEPQKSFPSGHVAMGFYFLALCAIGRRYQNRPLFFLGLFLTLFLGVGLMITRVVQGGHFFSDVIVSPILMWYVTKGLSRLIWRPKTLIAA